MNAKDVLVTTLKLVVISLVVTFLLVMTNGATVDKIAALQAQSAAEAKKEVLPEADDFSEESVAVDGESVVYYTADNGSGYVFECSNKGYGGPVVCMVGISADGQITGVKLTEQNETPGLGQKALNASFTDQYKQAVPDAELAVGKDGGTIDAIAGATITSRSVTKSVNQAVSYYKAITGGAN